MAVTFYLFPFLSFLTLIHRSDKPKSTPSLPTLLTPISCCIRPCVWRSIALSQILYILFTVPLNLYLPYLFQCFSSQPVCILYSFTFSAFAPLLIPTSFTWDSPHLGLVALHCHLYPSWWTVSNTFVPTVHNSINPNLLTSNSSHPNHRYITPLASQITVRESHFQQVGHWCSSSLIISIFQVLRHGIR